MIKIFHSFLISCFILTIFSCGQTTEENVGSAVSKTGDAVNDTGGAVNDGVSVSYTHLTLPTTPYV